jgi:hypothetical protein
MRKLAGSPPCARNAWVPISVLRRSLGWTAAAGIAVAGIPASAVIAAGPGQHPARGNTVTVYLSGRSAGNLPAGYLGLSFESGSAVNSGLFDAKGNLPRLLENLGVGVLRFGGASVDRSYPGATKTALAGLARLVRATGWHVIYTVNLGRFNASRVASDARAVAAALGGHLTAIACGNEPDIYARHGIRSASYTETDYLREARACIHAVWTGVPTARISGPNTFHLSWLPRYAAAEKRTISLLAEHYYPLTDCHGPNGTAATLLSRAKAAIEASTIGAADAAARTTRVPLQMAETNSASCGGIKGISNTFAAALWAIDYLLIGAEHGATGMNFHGSLTGRCDGYTPLCQVGTRQYAAQPVYYGLLFTHLLGTGRLLPVRVSPGPNIAAHAIRSTAGTVRVVLENLSGTAATVWLHVGRVSGTATALNLTGPTLHATNGERIQGAGVQRDGTFRPGAPSRMACHSGTCPIRVAGYSAVIVTLPGRPR